MAVKTIYVLDKLSSMLIESYISSIDCLQ
jgi:hypothetical protein